MGSNRVFGVDGAALQTSYGLPWEPVNLGAGSVYKVFTAATALDKGLGIDYQMQIPPDGYASPIYRDGQGNPFPVRNAGSLRPGALDDRRPGAVAEHRLRRSSWSTPASRPWSTWRSSSGMRSLAEPQGAGGTVDRRDRQGAEPGLVHPGRHPDQRPRALQRRGHARLARASGARRPRSSGSPTLRQRRSRSPSSPASRSSRRRWPTPS